METRFYINEATHASVYTDTEADGGSFSHLRTEIILYHVRGSNLGTFVNTLAEIMLWGLNLGQNEFGAKESLDRELWHIYLRDEDAVRFKLRWAGNVDK